MSLRLEAFEILSVSFVIKLSQPNNKRVLKKLALIGKQKNVEIIFFQKVGKKKQKHKIWRKCATIIDFLTTVQRVSF